MAQDRPKSGPPELDAIPVLEVPTALETPRPTLASPPSGPSPGRGVATGAPRPTPAPPAQDRTDPGASSGPRLRVADPATVPRAGRMPDMGPLDALMKDPTITEIMVNDLRNVMVEKDGKLMFSGFAYTSIDELNRLARNILDVTGRILTPDQPYVDVMLADGSRVNLVGPPLTARGPCITIRKFPTRQFVVEDLMNLGMLDRRIAYFLNVCVVARLNLVVSGGTGSGKTTLLAALTRFIPKGERVVTIEDTPELCIAHFNSVSLQTKPAAPTSLAVTARDLVANSLRMRPDRVLIGECRRAEAFDMLQAMNTGHEGSMTTLHANSPRDCLSRLETLCMLAGADLPLAAIRRQIESAIDVVVQVKRFRDGTRRIVAVSEVTGMEGDIITTQDVFTFEPDPNNPGATAQGRFKSTGLVPSFVSRLRAQGLEFPSGFFG